MNPLLGRIWDIWTNSPQDELLSMLDDWREDFFQDQTFLYAIDLMEEAIYLDDYNRIYTLIREFAPVTMSGDEFNIFLDIINEAEYA